MEGLIYPFECDFNQRNLEAAVILTVCFMSVDFAAVYSIHKHQIHCYSWQLNRSALRLFIHTSFYLWLSTRSFPFELHCHPNLVKIGLENSEQECLSGAFICSTAQKPPEELEP